MSPFFITFDDAGEWVASSKARALLNEAGFSVGPNQRGAPTAAMFGAYLVSKWRNLNREQRAETHATIEGDTRHGPVRIRLLPACPHEGAARFEAARADIAKTAGTPSDDHAQHGGSVG